MRKILLIVFFVGICVAFTSTLADMPMFWVGAVTGGSIGMLVGAVLLP